MSLICNLLSKWQKIVVFSLLLLAANFLCAACDSNSNTSSNETKDVELSDEEQQQLQRDYLSDSISNHFVTALETSDKIFFFKGKQNHYKPYLYILEIKSEKCDSLKDAFPIIYDYRTIDDNRIVMIEHDPKAGEGSLGMFAATAPQFYVDEYNVITGKIKCLVDGCASAEFVDSFDEKSGDRKTNLKIGEMVVLNPDACSADMEFGLKYKTINLTNNSSKAAVGKRPTIDPYAAAGAEMDEPDLNQIALARELYNNYKESLTIDEMVDLAYIFWELGNKKEKEIAVILMKTATKKDKKHVQNRIYNQSLIGWEMPGTPEYPDWLTAP